MKKFVSVGDTFGKLTVLSKAGVIGGATQWLCQCECGNTTTVRGGHLNAGRVRSCGCLATRRTHGYGRSTGRTPEYNTWKGIKNRCYNTKTRDYAMYGGRGITVHEGWKDDFPAFFAYVGPRPPGHSLDRINNDGNYEPGNVRWATVKEQARNKRRSQYVTYNGEKKLLVEWCEELDLNTALMRQRLNTPGWNVSRAFETPTKAQQNRAAIAAGDVFGRLTVVEFVEAVNGNSHVHCQCSCGNTTVVAAGHLKSGHTRSCGCAKKNRIQKIQADTGV